MGVHESMHLIHGEESEHNHRKGISPERVEPQRRDEQRLDQPERQQIQRCEVLSSVREVLRRLIQVPGNDFVAVEGKIGFEEFERDPIQLGGLDRPQDDAANSLKNTIDPFERDAGPKAFVKQ